MTRHTKLSRNMVSQDEREKYGCIATLRLRNGEVVSRHVVGIDAVQVVIAYCRALDAKVLTLSTPSTIYRDLQGNREDVARDFGMGKDYHRAEKLLTPERYMLARHKGLDVLDESAP